jgi:hypothetical protein
LPHCRTPPSDEAAEGRSPAGLGGVVSSPTIRGYRVLYHVNAHRCSSNTLYGNLIHRTEAAWAGEKACGGASLTHLGNEFPRVTSCHKGFSSSLRSKPWPSRPRGRAHAQASRSDGSAPRICTTQFAGKCSVDIFRASLLTPHRMEAVPAPSDGPNRLCPRAIRCHGGGAPS